MFPECAKTKEVHHQWTKFTGNIKRSSLSKKEKPITRNKKYVKEKILCKGKYLINKTHQPFKNYYKGHATKVANLTITIMIAKQIHRTKRSEI